jgi:hypothetical protein
LGRYFIFDQRPLSILLGQLNNNGDCLLATTIARQIKKDFPRSKLTWAISTNCRHVLDNNPFVDEVWEIATLGTSPEDVKMSWDKFVLQINSTHRVYDKVFLTQYSWGHFENFRGFTRASIFAGYPNPVTVPVQPVLRLTQSEIVNVGNFLAEHNIGKYKRKVVFECAAFSGQSFITEQFIQEFSNIFRAQFPNDCLILSAKKLSPTYGNIIPANKLTYRENAELLNHADLFIGCSSGISWLSISDWVRPLPKILLIDKDCPQASMIVDHKYFNLETKEILELKTCTPEQLAEMMTSFNTVRPVATQLLANFSFELISFIIPFITYYKAKHFRIARKIFFKANLRAKMSILKFLIKNLM